MGKRKRKRKERSRRERRLTTAKNKMEKGENRWKNRPANNLASSATSWSRLKGGQGRRAARPGPSTRQAGFNRTIVNPIQSKPLTCLQFSLLLYMPVRDMAKDGWMDGLNSIL